MARASRADRLEAENYIRRTITAKMNLILNSPAVKLAHKAALDALDKQLGYSETHAKMDKLQAKIDKLHDERSQLSEGLNGRIKAKSWQDNGWCWSYDKEYQSQQKVAKTEALEGLAEGNQLKNFQAALDAVSKKLFMATTHESLAALVEELS